MLRRTFVALSLAAAAAGGLSACGNQDKEVTRAESESAYLDVSGLKYQVQVSRQINPADPEDRDYLKGLSPADATLPAGTIWFGVFMRVENDGKKAMPASTDFTIKDTQEKLFKPVPVDNAFGYQAETVPPKGFIPDQERLAAYAGTQGEVLLYKIPVASLDNRPLELTIRSPLDRTKAAVVDLDV